MTKTEKLREQVVKLIMEVFNNQEKIRLVDCMGKPGMGAGELFKYLADQFLDLLERNGYVRLAEEKEEVMLQCEFDRKGVCYALSCYSHFKCKARDEKGNPIYSDRAKGGEMTGTETSLIRRCERRYCALPATVHLKFENGFEGDYCEECYRELNKEEGYPHITQIVRLEQFPSAGCGEV